MSTYQLLVEKNKKLKYIPGFILIALVIAMPLFAHLSELPIQRWDESRLALAAYEMLHHKNWVVTTFWWQPDLIALKPPLQIWLIAASIKIFGANVLAVRLPAALAAASTCLFLYWFLTAKLQKPLAGVIAPAILVVCEAYVRIHGVRTGDYDALLGLYTTIFLFYYYLYLRGNNGRELLIAIIALTFACFTKGVAGLMFMPGVFLFTLFRRQVLNVLKNKYFYIGIAVFILIIPGYYLLREQLAPGSWQGVVENELGGRFLKALEHHQEPWYFYMDYIFRTGFVWTFMALAAMATIYICKDNRERLFRSFISISLLGYLVVISMAGTKLDWYTIPLYPLLSALAALFITWSLSIVNNIKSKTNVVLLPLVLISGYSICYVAAYANTLERVMEPEVNLNDKTFTVSHFIHEYQKHRQVDSLTVLMAELDQEVMWYVHIDSNIKAESVFKLKPGDDIMVYKQECLNIINNTYYYEKTDEYYGIYRFHITGYISK